MSSRIADQSQRFEYLKLVFDKTEGDKLTLVNMWDIGDELGWDRSMTEATVQYLIGEGFVKIWTFGGNLGITHEGIKEIERASTQKQSEHFSDVINMSGDFRGAIVNIRSSLANVTQTVNAASNIETSFKSELSDLLTQLNEALDQVPADRIEEAEAVAETTEQLVEKGVDRKPNKTLIRVISEGLIQTARNLADVTPNVLSVATKVVEVIARLI